MHDLEALKHRKIASAGLKVRIVGLFLFPLSMLRSLSLDCVSLPQRQILSFAS